MKQNFTIDNLLPYLYQECTASQRLATEDAIHGDPVLQQELDELRAAKQQLPKVQFRAPQRSLQRILNYSRSTRLEAQF
ncbi:MAG: hypothetical protein D6772_00380 [Bacteroidetes bacterium]|nr:MAG: hypothetical protein D6772_00380 [Bacteroidota bacterium]